MKYNIKIKGGKLLLGRSVTSPVCGSPQDCLSISGSRCLSFPKSLSIRKDDLICLSYQDDREENSHVLTDFFLEELLRFLRLFRSENYCFFFRTNVTGNSMFHLPDSFQVHHHSINKILHFVYVFM